MLDQSLSSSVVDGAVQGGHHQVRASDHAKIHQSGSPSDHINIGLWAPSKLKKICRRQQPCLELKPGLSKAIRPCSLNQTDRAHTNTNRDTNRITNLNTNTKQMKYK